METWDKLSARLTELDAINGVIGLIGWDQMTYLPPAANEVRGQQSGVLEKLAHERFTAPEVGGWLAELEGVALDEVKTAAVRNASRSWRRATRVPGRLVEELARARADAYTAWLGAREADDYAPFARPLQRVIDLTREQGALLSDGAGHPYDALLEGYDPGSTVAELAPMFERLGRELGVLLAALDGKPHPAAFIERLDIPGQRKLSDRLLVDLGFDLRRGRLDDSEHPFTSGQHPTDVRLTSHFYEDDFLGGLGSTVHECGHGLYEQGLDVAWDGTGVNKAAGMGLHESQSRFWENMIGRSLPFFRYLVPRMQGIWPRLATTPEALYAGANRVERSLIRIYADEATYNLHILVRFGLECRIFEGALDADALPAAWDEAYRTTVGLVAPSAKQGVLQDVHWSSGLFGYFPSYTIGNLYAASFTEVMQQELPTMWEDVERGHFAGILGWLRERVHRRGHLKDAPLLVRDAVGDRDPVDDLVNHLWRRQGALYGVTRPA